MAKIYEDIEITKEDGTRVKMAILFTYDSNGKNYVLYYNPNDVKDENVYAYRFDDNGNLFEIEDEREWDEIQKVYESYMEDLDNDEEF